MSSVLTWLVQVFACPRPWCPQGRGLFDMRKGGELMDSAEILAAVWMVNHAEDLAQNDNIEGYVRQFNVLVKNFRGTAEALKDD